MAYNSVDIHVCLKNKIKVMMLKYFSFHFYMGH